MSKSDAPAQLDMSFEADDRFSRRLREGQFFLVIELNSPDAGQPFESGVAIGTAMARRIRSMDDVLAIAVTDRFRREDCHDPMDTASRFADASQKPVVLCCSGKGSDGNRIRDLLARARSGGVRTVFAVTGDRSEQHLFREGSRRIPPYEKGYLDSLDIIRLVRESCPDFCIGAAVNPFKYNPADQCLQYYKMIRKLNSGAQYIVTHAGWDMKKLQELQWFLRMREIGHAVIARVLLLSLDDINGIHRGLFPGVPVSLPFAAALQRESNISATQSMAAQLHRIGLQIAGCRLMGYSGVQIAGIRDLQTLDMVTAKVRECLAKFTDYATWLAGWNDYHDSMPFAPVPHAYYGFHGLLTAENPEYDPEKCHMTDCTLPVPSMGDRLRSRLLPLFLSASTPARVASAARFLLGRRQDAAADKLKYCYYLPHAQCPKRLVYGACGGSDPEGICEFGHAPCFFHRVIALASQRHELDLLEEGIGQ